MAQNKKANINKKKLVTTTKVANTVKANVTKNKKKKYYNKNKKPTTVKEVAVTPVTLVDSLPPVINCEKEYTLNIGKIVTYTVLIFIVLCFLSVLF